MFSLRDNFQRVFIYLRLRPYAKEKKKNVEDDLMLLKDAFYEELRN